MRVTVIDYKAGNLTSVLKALRHVGAEPQVTDGDCAPIETAERIVLPGVGHFAATGYLDARGLTPAIRDAIARGVPFLGICVGMQWLMQGSEEAPEQPGLGHFLGHCKRFPESENKVPHVGWNKVRPRTKPPSALLAANNSADEGEFAYFTHSYYVDGRGLLATEQASAPSSAAAALTWYAVEFASAIEHENVFGVQFHPEKSGDTGLRILANFLSWEAS